MPPTGDLKPHEVELLKAWIDQGAEWPDKLANEVELPPLNLEAVAAVDLLHNGDVAGFIGPEVFRTKTQLVRVCLEDTVMGKLHGLTIGLDICSTLHMEVTLDDLGLGLVHIAPPGQLAATTGSLSTPRYLACPDRPGFFV